MQCKKCGTDMKLIPAGTSKRTRKDYNAFYSCMACNVTAPAEQQEVPKKSEGVEKILLAIESSNEEILSELQKVMDFRVKMFDKFDELFVAIENISKK